MRNPTKTKLRVLALTLTASLSLAAGALAETAGGHRPHDKGRDYDLSAEDREWVEKMQLAMLEARRRLQSAHGQALQDDRVKASLEQMRAAIEKEMIRLAPDKKKDILRRYEVYAELRGLQTSEPSPEGALKVSELTVEYETLNRDLGDLPKQALEAAAVKKKQDRYNEVLRAKMTEIDPDVPDLMNLQKQIVEEFVAYRERMLKDRHRAKNEPSPEELLGP